MRLFLAGDYRSNTGPAQVTNSLLRAMPSDTLYQKMQHKCFRIFEIILNTCKADVIIYSGLSRQVPLGIKIAHIFHKPVFYLMHGSIKHEGHINHEYSSALLKQEEYVLDQSDYILAVSIPFKNWLKQNYPKLVNKIYHLTNAIDWDLINMPPCTVMRKSMQIMSIGGGMPRKNILSICKAIEKIYSENPSCTIRLLVAGNSGDDLNNIKSYPFVDYVGIIPHEQVLTYMQQSSVYVQNSVFETFGIAPLEALLCGCSLLLSHQTGALSIIPAANEDMIINDAYDINEISRKLSHVLCNPNHEQLLSSVNFETSCPHYRVQELFLLIESLIRIS